MPFIASFLEGIITFISPCLLPMIPIYVSYFAGSGKGTRAAVINSLGFILGFTVVFVTLGAFAGVLGRLLVRNQTLVNVVTGGIVVIFGLNYMGLIKIGFLNNARSINYTRGETGFISSFVFGLVFSVCWTPCVGAFLGSALMLASQQGSVGKGMLMLLCYSMGLAVPFLISAVLIDNLKEAFGFIKRNYKTVQFISGVFLVIVGMFMMSGALGRLLSALTF